MRKIVFFFICLLTIMFSRMSAQDTIPEFCPKGARWIYDSFWIVFGEEIPENYSPYIQLVYERDTVIDGLEAKILVESSVRLDTVVYYKDIIMRQEGWRIYFYADGAFHLLYDYSLEVGDRYTIYIDPWYMDSRDSLLINVSIDSVMEIELNGVKMPAYFTYDFRGEFIFAGWSYFKTGNLSYLLVYDDLLCDAIECPYYLRCYEDEEFSISRRDYPCDALFTTSFFQKEDKTSVQIYPNPVGDKLYLNSDDNLLSYEIYDQLGHLVRRSKFISQPIDVSDLLNGIYFLRTRFRSQIIFNQFVKG